MCGAVAAGAWSTAEVGEWLEARGLGRLCASFAEHEVDGSVLLSLTAADLDFVGLRALGPRKKLMAAVAGLRGSPSAPLSVTARSMRPPTPPPPPSPPRPPRPPRPPPPGREPSALGVCVRSLCVLVLFVGLHVAFNDSVLEMMGVGRRTHTPMPTPAALQLSMLQAADAKRAGAQRRGSTSGGGDDGGRQEL
jgi:hypothetical protein